MDWSNGFSAAYYMALVDPVTWRDIERVEIVGGSVASTGTGLRQSADVVCTEFNPDCERWARIYLEAAQDGDALRVPLFTGLTSVPGRNIDGNRIQYPLTCYSVLKPAEDVLLPRGWYAPAGFSGAAIVADLLSVTPAPVTYMDNAPALAQPIIAEDRENRLTMANKVLAAINWRLRIAGDGSISVCPKASEAVAVFGMERDIVEPSITVRADWFSCPNVFRAISGGESAVARDDDESSALSTAVRGREIWKEETNCDISDGESLDDYAVRRLRELQTVSCTLSYSRRYDPSVLVGDLIQMRYPAQDLTEVYEVTAQTITLGYGARTSEEARRWI